MKNSEMVFQAILNKPQDLDAYRAYADALIEEGEEVRGERIISNLGKCFKFNWPRDGIGEQRAFHCILPDNVVFSYQFTTKNCFLVDLHITLVDFMRSYKFFFKHHPIQSVLVCDCNPVQYGDEEHVYWEEAEDVWVDEALNYWLLPRELTEYLPHANRVENHPMSSRHRTAYFFADIMVARQALSIAAVKLGRKSAGLLPLPEDGYAKLDYTPVRC